ncbi:MAG: anthranilate synthase component I family protein [Phycisphaeraceae bacterium]|nr:MAG: anthranilate synthase component I family protein [Phycisphaeraceae bacterium]
MTTPPPPRPIDLHLAPRDVLGAWPASTPLASFGPLDPHSRSPWSRWTILAQPDPARTIRLHANPPRADVHHALDFTARTPATTPAPVSPDDRPPFVGGWFVLLNYALGRSFEPAAQGPRPPTDDRAWPALLLLRCDRAWCYDHETSRWFAVGDTAGLPPAAHPAPDDRFTAQPARSPTGGESYRRAVARVIEYIRAGDAYQVNLAHRFSAPYVGSPRALLRRVADATPARHAAYLEDHHRGASRAVISASPELFFTLDPKGRITTRPMKGTRPAHRAAELLTSDKDRAELAMIVDLMRNDLGRVCRFGSVRVDQTRVIEPHGTVAQAVATVSGVLRDGLGVADVLAAMFPGGSVTGAPKVRAMQIIDELEPADRGPYCGALGFLSDDGHAALNIAIRTFALTADAPGRGTLDYWAGAGIVADSDPNAEWRETLDKAGPLRAITTLAEDLS